MKKAFLLAALFLASIASAAIAKWEAGSNSTLTASYVGGTAYFIEVANGGPSLSTMINTIKTGGLSATNTNVTLWGSTSIVEDSGYRMLETQTLSPVVTENATSTYYILFVDATSQNFVFSDGEMSSQWTAIGANSQYNLTFYEDTGNQGSWANNGGVIGSTDVPEPTVLALLALGVAGLALKRKQL